MKRLVLALALLTGCAEATVHSDTTLARVVVYKSGVAYFERSAVIADDKLRVSVPPERMDDFLKSLTVVDATTGAAAPIAYPRAPGSSGAVDLEVRLNGPGPHRLKVSYVTEAPAWKPTYRVVLGEKGKVSLEGWAIVDNDSAEDWKDIDLGVGSSSALSFRFDLRPMRSVQREELAPNDRFAFAPPTGESPYGGDDGVLGALSDEVLRPTPVAPEELVARMAVQHSTMSRQLESARAQKDVVKTLCLSDKANQIEVAERSAREHRQKMDQSSDADVIAHERTILTVLKQRGDQLLAEANQCLGEEASYAGQTAVQATVDPNLPSPEDDGGENLAQMAKRQRDMATKQVDATVPAPAANPQPKPQVASDLHSIGNALRNKTGSFVVEGYASPTDTDPYASSLARATEAREQIVAMGVSPERLSVAARGRVPGHSGVRVVKSNEAPKATMSAEEALAQPIGASHFESKTKLSIARGSSAMISMIKTETEGEVVYLYDPESPRGNATFPFRSVRLTNPTDGSLESGPVVVFGEGRFVGEGMCEPIPSKSVGFVPFALDRQIVADPKTTESDGLPKVVRADRDGLTTEVEHTRRHLVTLTNRTAEAAIVFVRHTVARGFELASGPKDRERAGGAYLFRVEVPARGKVDVAIEEKSTVVKTTDVRSPEGLEIARIYVASASADPFKDRLAGLVKLVEDAAGIERKIAQTRARLADERTRADALRAQIATLKSGHTSATLVQPLDKKLGELDRRVSKSTLDLVDLDERLAVARVGIGDMALELRFEPNSAHAGGGEKKDAARSRW